MEAGRAGAGRRREVPEPLETLSARSPHPRLRQRGPP